MKYNGTCDWMITFGLTVEIKSNLRYDLVFSFQLVMRCRGFAFFSDMMWT